MDHKCPVCGAPMDGNHCNYCDYRAETVEADNGQEQVIEREVVVIKEEAANSGNPVVVVQGSAKSKGVALGLCIFLGWLGGHQFYAGKAGMGILYLLTLGLFGIGWVIDIIRIATGSFKDQYGLPLR